MIFAHLICSHYLSSFSDYSNPILYTEGFIISPASVTSSSFTWGHIGACILPLTRCIFCIGQQNKTYNSLNDICYRQLVSFTKTAGIETNGRDKLAFHFAVQHPFWFNTSHTDTTSKLVQKIFVFGPYAWINIFRPEQIFDYWILGGDFILV